MGYYTDYDFSNNPIEVIEAIERESGYGNSYGGFYTNVKWYNHDDDMLRVSKMFPDIILKLEGEGEESDDLWKAYYKNGKMRIVKAKIVFEDFDESKMEEYK